MNCALRQCRVIVILKALMWFMVLCGAGPAISGDKDKIALNFVNTEIDAVVKAVSIVSGRNFVIDPRVKGTINVVSSNAIEPALAYPILVSALRLQGFAVVEVGNMTKILPEADAKTHAIPIAGRGSQGDGRMVTRVFAVRGESVAQLLPVLRPLVASNNAISAYPASNALVITDYADNLRRIERIIESIEQGATENPAVFRLKYVAAADTVALLSRLFGDLAGGATGSDTSQRATFAIDSRSNAIIARSESGAVLGRVRSLLAELDQPPATSGNIHVVSLKNAEAGKLAQTLRSILGSEGPTGAATGPGQIPSTGPTAPTNGSAKASSIQADTSTNSLIIVAPEPVFNNLRRVIDLLDRRRAQVHIEALIVELSADRATELGFQWQAYANATNGSARIIGGTGFGAAGTGRNILDVARSPGVMANGMMIGIVKGQVTVPGLGTINNLGMLARFLETDSNANILSTPNLVTLDNEEGKIVIGQNLPFVTGQYAQTGAAVSPTPFQTIERRDVGLSLRVKPQVSEGGTVRVQISQEVSSVNSLDSMGPVTNKRSIDSTVLIDDGGIIALGGLMEDRYGDGEDKVPLLGDLPVVGDLFRYGTRKRTKTNLMVFLRPQVIRDEGDNERIATKHYERLYGEQSRLGSEERLMPGEDLPPRLPAGTLPKRGGTSGATGTPGSLAK